VSSISEVRALLVIPVLAAAILAAGCGGGSSSSSTTGSSATGSSTTSADDWANSVCEAFTTWTTTITSAGQSIKDNPTDDGLRSAGDDIKSATQSLSDELKGLGRPDTNSGQQAKDAVDQLATKLDANQQKIETAIDDASGASGALTAVSTVSATLVTMGNDIGTTFQQLDQIDGQGELADAFQQSDACAGLTTTTS
jgi:hypothetical protein